MKQLLEFLHKIDRRMVYCIAASSIGGILLFGLVRFVFQPDTAVHYHANFAVFINGQREAFKGPQYYQEIAACSQTTLPQDRVHMHDNVNHVVHVHASLVTWANFFSVLGWSLQDNSLFDGKQAYTDGDNGNLRFILNGKPVLSIANEVIRSDDRLLVSFGPDDSATLMKEYSQVSSDAQYYNEHVDPSTCKGPEELTVWQRLEKAFWF